jgi:CRISPR-associated protein Cas2
MRLLVILSPTEKWGTKTEYTKLRKFLHKDGYLRIAPEVYMRIVQNRKASEKHLVQCFIYFLNIDKCSVTEHIIA